MKVIITEDIIRSDLRMNDAEGTACLLNEAIFKGLARMRSTMASATICLADNQKFNFSKYSFDNMVKSLEGGVKFYLFPRFISTMASATICLADNQKFNFSKYSFDNMVKSLEGGVKFYLFPRFLMRRIGAGFSRVITPLFKTMMVQAPADMDDIPVETYQTPIVDQPSTSKPQKPQNPRRKQRKEAEISHDELEDEDHVPTPSSDPLPS
nr:hypothetical protein [Tanacetum cinerariifolium]